MQDTPIFIPVAIEILFFASSPASAPGQPG